MRLTWEQRSQLVIATAELVVQWLALLDNNRKVNLICNMLVGYSSPELERLSKQAAERIAARQARRGDGQRMTWGV